MMAQLSWQPTLVGSYSVARRDILQLANGNARQAPAWASDSFVNSAAASPAAVVQGTDAAVLTRLQAASQQLAMLQDQINALIAQAPSNALPVFAGPLSAPPPPPPPPPPLQPLPAPLAAPPAPAPSPKPVPPTPAPAKKSEEVAKPAVVSMPSPNFNDRPAGTKIDTIVLHHTASAGSAQDVGRYFANSASQVSSHYIIGKDGTIVQSVPDSKRAWHAGSSDFHGHQNVNDFSLGIEMVNKGDNHDPFTDAQYEALAKLVAYQMTTYGIAMDHITGHKNVSHEGKIDPADNFDWEKFKRLVQQKLGKG